MRLTALANKFRTDKGTVAFAGHAYTAVYEMLFEPLRDRPIDLLEIGLSAGGPEVGQGADRTVIDAPSMRLWHEYFPKARIHGLDISDFSQFRSDWFVFFRADCGDAAQLEQVIRSGAQFDIVIDDGSHASFHEQLALCTLFAAVKPGGLYIIEDLNWQPEAYEKTLPSVPKTVDLLVDFLATGRLAGSTAISQAKWDEVAKHVANVMLFDEDQLVNMRRLYNDSTGDRPEMPHYLDSKLPRLAAARAYARRVLEASVALARAVRADVAPHRPRIKLAVLQKR